MEIRFTPYAEAQIRERELSPNEIRQAQAEPEQVLSGKHGRMIAHKRLTEAGKEYLLRIIFEESERHRIVVTVYMSTSIGAGMRMRYDPSVDILYIRLREGHIEESDEITPEIIADYGHDGKLMGLEILDASEILGGRQMRVELAVAEGSDAT